ncbi:MAG TPA: DUF488 domain-containing protein [Anaeromyxobacteraceae bacterium]|nr:DUF488 domain-containing protein [Anaeromyxobacteraceae bacterium]
MVRIKRAYAPAESNDGYRVLVDRLWPRGVTRARAALDLWAKDLAPSPELCTWFGHDAGRFAEFAERYRQELKSSEAHELLRDLALRAAGGPVTLVYGARDEVHNQAVVLQGALERQEGATPAVVGLKRKPPPGRPSARKRAKSARRAGQSAAGGRSRRALRARAR